MSTEEQVTSDITDISQPFVAKKLTDWFDKVFVINCQHRPDRLKEFVDEIISKEIADLDKITIFQAVIGDFTTHPAGWGGGKGAWGCLQSHRRILEDLMHMRDDRLNLKWKSALILEDDVFFLDNALVNLEVAMNSLPDVWGQLYLGGQHMLAPIKINSEGLVAARSINRTHAYAIHADHVQAIYRHISYMMDYNGNNYHIDHQLERAHRRGDWPVYALSSWICGQRANTSNVSGRKLPAHTWQ